jgi:flavin reductase (DIM6/NTAB) family NADH-FMN oxidoreductase RutF
MKAVNAFNSLDNILMLLKQGAFLTVKNQAGLLNTMTIGWATIGYIWRAEIMMVAVRPTRFTFDIIDKAKDFTVTIPFEDMSKALNFCGTNSGLNVDKFKECNLTIEPGQKVNSPIIKISGRHYECKIVQAVAVDKSRLDPGYQKTVYQDNAYHTLYFGEIRACYET